MAPYNITKDVTYIYSTRCEDMKRFTRRHKATRNSNEINNSHNSGSGSQ